MNAETSQVEKSNRVSDSGDTRGCEATLKKKNLYKDNRRESSKLEARGGKSHADQLSLFKV